MPNLVAQDWYMGEGEFSRIHFMGLQLALASWRERKGGNRSASNESLCWFVAEVVEKINILGAALLLRLSQEALKGLGTLLERAMRKLLIYGSSLTAQVHPVSIGTGGVIPWHGEIGCVSPNSLIPVVRCWGQDRRCSLMMWDPDRHHL